MPSAQMAAVIGAIRPLCLNSGLLQAGDEIKTFAGSWRVRTDKGHSDAQISLMDRERGLFLSVDFLLPRISPNISADIRDPDFDLLSAYFIYLKEMTELPADMQIFPGHDWPFRHGGVRAQQLIDHHNHRLDLLSCSCSESSTDRLVSYG